MANSAYEWITKGFGDNGIWNPIDFLLPGTSILNSLFDPKGGEAALNQFDSQYQLQKDQQAFNAEEAQKARDWQAEMSNSAFQRSMVDLKAAGINPALAYMNPANSGSAVNSATGSEGSAAMANNKMAQAAGVIALFLKTLVAK